MCLEASARETAPCRLRVGRARPTRTMLTRMNADGSAITVLKGGLPCTTQRIGTSTSTCRSSIRKVRRGVKQTREHRARNAARAVTSSCELQSSQKEARFRTSPSYQSHMIHTNTNQVSQRGSKLAVAASRDATEARSPSYQPLESAAQSIVPLSAVSSSQTHLEPLPIVGGASPHSRRSPSLASCC